MNGKSMEGPADPWVHEDISNNKVLRRVYTCKNRVAARRGLGLVNKSADRR